MKEKYDRVNVDRFVEEVKGNLKDDALLKFLYIAAWSETRNEDRFVVPTGTFGVWNELKHWSRLSTWEKTNVLFTLAPRVQEIVLKRARALSKLAREEDSDRLKDKRSKSEEITQDEIYWDET